MQCDRHTAADLKAWAELEETDLIYYDSHDIQSKVNESLRTIESFAALGPSYAGVSWGKDSVVLAHLLAMVRPDVPIIWLTYDLATNPTCYPVRDAFLALHPELTYHEYDVGIEEKRRDDYSDAVRITGTNRYFSGIRADESGIRKMSIFHHGVFTDRACRPLAWWKNSDIFAYIAYEQLPLNPVYGMLGGDRWPRRHLRTASIGGERGTEYGRGEWEREYFPDVLNRIVDKKRRV
ncbi:MAG: phosphoadenosine phosphosulfate reductase family protein [Rectinemataceae bacterium]